MAKRTKTTIELVGIDWELKKESDRTLELYKRTKKPPKKNPLREKVWMKFNKHCAYYGKELEYKDMQIDHLFPKAYGGNDSLINLMPSCRRCNHYKRVENLEGFRGLIATLHKRISDLYIGKVAIDYGIITVTPFSGKFYFEIVSNTDYKNIDLMDLILINGRKLL